MPGWDPVHGHAALIPRIYTLRRGDWPQTCHDKAGMMKVS